MNGSLRLNLRADDNRHPCEYLKDKCLHQLFEAQVERHPEAIAVVCERVALSYQELNQRANQLAHYLRIMGVKRDVLVGICMDRSAEMIVALLAILKAGGAYLPLDPAYPTERLAFMVEDSGAPLVLSQQKLAGIFKAANALKADSIKVVMIDEPIAPWNDLPAMNLANQSMPDDLAYVIFTSGSTGQPKGVLNTHYNVVRLMQATEAWFEFNETDVWTMFHSHAFDFSVWEIWGALFHGGKLVVVPYYVSRSPHEFYELLIRERVTVLNQTPTAFRQLMQTEETRAAVGALALRYVIFGGEALAMSSLRPWFERHGDERPQLVNMYGITETTVHVTYRPLKHADVDGPSVIGVPIPDLQLYILDADFQSLPAGETGELFVGGAGLARGYLNRPDLTRERFVTAPAHSEATGRLYRTGDLARHLPNGDIEYLGRSDNQIKIRGHRIELGEIEAALRAHPGVAECVAVVQSDGPGESSLCAFIEGRTKNTLEESLLRSWLRGKLPEHMIPFRFQFLDRLPITTNGKLDRKALASPRGPELTKDAPSYTPPRTEMEIILVEIWQLVLRRERVGVHDNFFDLGGHSLLGAAICAHISNRLGIQAPLRWMVEYPTIARWTERARGQEGRPRPATTISLADRRQPIPLSFGQQQMWLLQQMQPDGAAYNEPVAWRLPGDVDRRRIQAALRRIMDRHEVLRTAFARENGELVQEIKPSASLSVPWDELNLTDVAGLDKAGALTRHLTEWSRKPFDLSQAPLWRAIWVDLGGEEQLLAFTFHHSIIDEWSLRLFAQELMAFHGDSSESPAAAPALPVQMADFALWQRQQLTGVTFEEHQAFWRKELQNLPASLRLPFDVNAPGQPTGKGAVCHFPIPGPVVAGLRSLARQENTTLFIVALAAFQAWLYRNTGETDIIVGTPFAHRDRLETQSLLGYFLNTIPVRSRVDGEIDFLVFLRQVRQTVLDAFDHALLPFEQMAELAMQERPAEQNSLYQVMFVLIEEGLPPLRLGRCAGSPVSITTQTSKNDLTLSIQATGDIGDCQLAYATDLFTPDCAAAMARHFTQFLAAIAETPAKSIGALSEPLNPNRDGNHQTPPASRLRDANNDGSCLSINVLEGELIQIWRRLFNRTDISRQDNFFALGGHSLLATRLAGEIEKLLGCKVPIAALFQSPSIETLASRLLDEQWAPIWKSLVPLQPHGTKPPLFFVHGVGGDVFSFVELAGLLGPDQPSYGIQAVGVDGKSTRHITVEEMAAHYVKEIVSFQPGGPVYLAGYSLGGIIAYEIAQQLHRAGRRVGMLALLDCGPVGASPWIFYCLAMATYVPKRCWLHLRRWVRLPRHEKILYLQGRWVALWNLAKENRAKPRLVTAPPAAGDKPPQLEMSLVDTKARKVMMDIDYYHAIALPYKLAPYPGTMDLFASDQSISGWRWYWRHLVRGEVSFHKIPGQHLEILSGENVAVLGKSLTEVLQRKQARS